MDNASQAKVYVIVFLTIAAAIMLPVLVLNCILGLRSLGDDKAVMLASEWQQATRGVTYAPPLSNNRPFKTARLFGRLPEINTVVFGSSTAMGVTQSMFPHGMRLYNFAQSGNGLATVVAEAEFVQHRQPDIQWLVIPLDWALGFIYQAGAPEPADLSPPAAGAPGTAGPPVSLLQQMQDALSLPRLRNLFGILQGIVRAASPSTAFRQMFWQNEGEEYRCADGTPARDFDTIFRGTCTGFRDDGSATFANLEPVAPRRAQALIASAVVPSSKYASALARSGGEPNSLILDRIAALARGMRTRGGGVILFMPPLLPGLERALLDAPHTASQLRHTKDVLRKWAHAQNLVIIDAGQAERYGCLTPEFVDEHHALPQCYARIFSRYWRDIESQGALSAGLYPND